MSTARANAASVSGMVTFSRELISGPTGSELTNDVPRSPLANCPIQWMNCSGSGRSEPMECRAAAICSGLAPTEVRAFAGSPGSIRSSTNRTTLASASETNRKARRRRRYRPISPS